jgi:hypothetical protein
MKYLQDSCNKVENSGNFFLYHVLVDFFADCVTSFSNTLHLSSWKCDFIFRIELSFETIKTDNPCDITVF